MTTGPLQPRVDFTFVPDSEGTAVTFSISAPLTGLEKLLMWPIAQKSMDHAADVLPSFACGYWHLVQLCTRRR